MKGIVFTQFLSMSEQLYGYKVVDEIIEESNLPSQGIYTAVGTYDHSEIVTLLVNLSKKVSVPPAILLRTFGRHLFVGLANTYPHLLQGTEKAFDLLKLIDSHIHVNVLKLYPDAQLPHFEITQVDDITLWMDYTSERNMGELAHGLIEQCIVHYGQKANVSQQVLEDKVNTIRFEIVIEP